MKLCQNRKRINCKQGQDPQSASGSLTLGPFPALPPPVCSLPLGLTSVSGPVNSLTGGVREVCVPLERQFISVTCSHLVWHNGCYLLKCDLCSAMVCSWTLVSKHIYSSLLSSMHVLIQYRLVAEEPLIILPDLAFKMYFHCDISGNTLILKPGIKMLPFKHSALVRM